MVSESRGGVGWKGTSKMATINSAFNLITNALNADQEGLSVVANNVANANTPGYTRETTIFTETQPITINGQQFGTGVSNSGPISVRDGVLEARLVQQQQMAASSAARLTALNTLQALFTPNSGSSASSNSGDIGADVTRFFNSLSSLAKTPTDNSLRQSVLSSASTLAANVSNAAGNLNSQQSAVNAQASSIARQVNALTTSLAALNKQIQSTSPNSDAGVLEDQRVQQVSQLSQLIGVNQITTEHNGLTLTTTSGQLLVSNSQSVQMTTGDVSGLTHFFLGTTDITAGLGTGGGQLGGLLKVRDQDIPNAMAALDQMAYSVSTQVNTVNNAGTDMAGDNGGAGNIFYPSATLVGSALNMSVVMKNPNKIAAAGLGAATGDNTNVTAMAALGNQAIVAGETPSNAYSNFVTTLGATVSSVQTENMAQTASVSQLQSQVHSLSSVSLNDEAAAMQQLERSYQAASQVFALLNSLMGSALNLGVTTSVN